MRKTFSGRRALLFLCMTFPISSILTAPIVYADEAEYDNARKVFEQYKKLDLAGDAKLIDLYAADAKIESDVERKDTPLQKEHYDRAKYSALITKTFADPVLAKLSAATVYDSPTIKNAGVEKDALKVEFHAYQGDTAMKVHWLLRKKADGQWLIEKEHAITYRKSLGRQGGDENEDTDKRDIDKRDNDKKDKIKKD